MTAKKKGPGGRPKKKIDYEQVRKLAEIGCTRDEIANHLDLSKRTLDRDEEFSRVYKKGLGKVKMSLRRKQITAANKGNTVMLIWLGKNLLGQKDNPIIDEDVVKKIMGFRKVS